MRCVVDGISHLGEGVSRIDGKAVFIPYAIPGETVEIEITENKKKFLRARLKAVVDPSPDRIEPLCPHYYTCGGCAYQHVSYYRQLELKRQVVEENMKRIGRINTAVKPVLGMEIPWRYRNKVEWHVTRINDKICMGYFQNDSHRLIDIDTCKLISEEMEELTRYIKTHADTFNFPEQFNLIIRQSSVTHGLMVIFKGHGCSKIIFANLITYPGLESIISIDGDKQLLMHGLPYLQEQIEDISYDLSPLAFFQVNHAQTTRLYNLIKDYNEGKARQVLDAYCGIGSISLFLAREAEKMVGVESYNPAIENARTNADKNHINNSEFICGPCEKIIPELKESFDLIILDPPRAGCKNTVIDAIIGLSPEKIIYVSCNPATLARDLAVFVQSGYQIIDVQPVDMFPQTHHVECVVLMSRVEK